MAKPQVITSEELLDGPDLPPDTVVGVHVVAPPDNDELQSELDAKRAFEAQTEPSQPFLGASSEFRAELQAKANNAALERSKLEATRVGITARIDDLYAVENACKSALDVLK